MFCYKTFNSSIGSVLLLWSPLSRIYIINQVRIFYKGHSTFASGWYCCCVCCVRFISHLHTELHNAQRTSTIMKLWTVEKRRAIFHLNFGKNQIWDKDFFMPKMQFGLLWRLYFLKFHQQIYLHSVDIIWQMCVHLTHNSQRNAFSSDYDCTQNW